MVGMVWGSATGSEPLATGDEFYEKRTGACGSSNFVSFQQPLEHFVLGDALLDFAQTSGLLERRVHLSWIGAALARDLRHSVVDIRLRRFQRLALGDRFDDQIATDLTLGDRAEFGAETIALFFGNLIGLEVAVDELID